MAGRHHPVFEAIVSFLIWLLFVPGLPGGRYSAADFNSRWKCRASVSAVVR